jgi:hypothetical protein
VFVLKEFYLTAGRLLVYAGALAAVPTLAATTRDDTAIQQWLNQHAHSANSVEVAGARYRVAGDLDGDGRADVAVLYTLKPRAPRRGELRYLAAFRRLPETTRGSRGALRYHGHVLVSGPGAGEANRVTILERAVVVEMLTFKPGDAACCPTRATTRRYRMTPRGLALITADAPKRAR